MRILMINSVCGTGSTGRICTDLAKQLEKEGHEVKIAYGRHKASSKFDKYAVRIGNGCGVKLHAVRTRWFDDHGFGSATATKKFLRWADSYNPDLVWLHNVHGYYINIDMLFAWIKSRPEMQVKWTLHDCWAFTGHCTYFTAIGCQAWKTQCQKCKQLKEYPASFVDGCQRNFERKKKAFTGVVNMQIITPSQWLADLVKESFLKDYPVEVRHNKIDLTVFRPTTSDFRSRFHLEGKKIILGVAATWGARKGFNDFLKLAERLDKSETIVMVGLTKKQIKNLPSNIIGIPRTNSPQELAEIYTAADVFFNPTYEDNYPTVNLEAQACGTPVLTYNTGGSVESVPPENVIPTGDLDAVVEKLRDTGRLHVIKQ